MIAINIVSPVLVATGLKPIAEKLKIAEYMKNGKAYCASARAVTDRITGELVGIEDNWKTDGEYCWSADTIYHFEKYNAVLPDTFIEHIREACRT